MTRRRLDLIESVIMLVVTVIVVIILASGCCWMAKRDCFPPCPPPQATVVEVEKDCKLPPTLKLEAFHQTTTCPVDLVCYDRDNAAKLAKRLEDMRDWIVEARQRCAPPSSQPASQPSSNP